jgi:hypothetical protein
VIGITNLAYEKLAEKLREKDPAADKESVKKSTTDEVHLGKK